MGLQLVGIVAIDIHPPNAPIRVIDQELVDEGWIPPRPNDSRLCGIRSIEDPFMMAIVTACISDDDEMIAFSIEQVGLGIRSSNKP